MFLSLRFRQPRGVTRIRTEASSLHPMPRASGPGEMGLESTREPHATRHEMSIMWMVWGFFWLDWNLVAACRLSLVAVSRGCSLAANARASHCYGFSCRSQALQLWCSGLS